ncbi:MAG: peptidoglycan-binding protein [Phycisphaerales bacterium]|nr:MAG: peptidoglycan-binding protein [Phycisphaerales bacterium]
MPINHVVKPGDCISSISCSYGFFPDTIWNDPANAELKQERDDPNVLAAGDVVVIPDRTAKEESCPTGDRHWFRKRGIPAKFRLQVFDGEEPLADQPYTVVIDGVGLPPGRTDATGLLEVSIPPRAMRGVVFVGEGDDEHEIEFDLGQLPPVTDPIGVQARLNNLGFFCGEENAELNPQTQAALLAFQQRFGLEETGEPDETTCNKLLEIHDKINEFPQADDSDGDAASGDAGAGGDA